LSSFFLIARGVLVAICASLTIADSAFARTPEIYTGLLAATALGGYDPVAYFTQGKAVAGKRDITFTWKGVSWRFATESNRDVFKENPDAYAPQYGGYCAWAVSRGYTAKGDPRYWKVVDGKLYLNYDAGVQKDWEKDIPANIRKADANWPKVLDK
jgi:YHS domain-containing protein